MTEQQWLDFFEQAQDEAICIVLSRRICLRPRWRLCAWQKRKSALWLAR